MLPAAPGDVIKPHRERRPDDMLDAVAALGPGGAEIIPHDLQPFGGLTDDGRFVDGHVLPPDLPGIGIGAGARW